MRRAHCMVHERLQVLNERDNGWLIANGIIVLSFDGGK
jgi:hypothetical protein